MNNRNESAVNEFAVAVEKYCHWVEQFKLLPKSDSRELFLILSEIQFQVLRLPSIDYRGLVGKKENGSKWNELITEFSALPFTDYSTVFDALNFKDMEVIVGSLPDDLSDIYADLKVALSAYSEGEKEMACAAWLFSYWSHWGRHLTGALRALFCYHSKIQSE